jgi:RNA polymerase sigma-70 factor (ECF subfamily)
MGTANRPIPAPEGPIHVDRPPPVLRGASPRALGPDGVVSLGHLAPATVAVVASNDPPDSGVVPDPVLPAVAAGDDRAMAELWHRYADRVRALGLRLSSHDTGFADDLVQETFAKLWRGASRFDPARGTETTFVFTVARRAAVDQWRRGRRAADDRPLDHLPEASGAVTTGPGAPEAHVESVVTGWAVAEALDALPRAQREVIDLAYYHQLTQREIAERLDIPLGTVKTRTFNALKTLRVEMATRGVTT